MSEGKIMNKEKNTGIGFFQKYSTIWVVTCMAVGVLIGKFIPSIPAFLNQFEYAKVSIPVAILIWVMIYPMMKVDFQARNRVLEIILFEYFNYKVRCILFY